VGQEDIDLVGDEHDRLERSYPFVFLSVSVTTNSLSLPFKILSAFAFIYIHLPYSGTSYVPVKMEQRHSGAATLQNASSRYLCFLDLTLTYDL
jgi:hypothetical protein